MPYYVKAFLLTRAASEGSNQPRVVWAEPLLDVWGIYTSFAIHRANSEGLDKAQKMCRQIADELVDMPENHFLMTQPTCYRTAWAVVHFSSPRSRGTISEKNRAHRPPEDKIYLCLWWTFPQQTNDVAETTFLHRFRYIVDPSTIPGMHSWNVCVCAYQPRNCNL